MDLRVIVENLNAFSDSFDPVLLDESQITDDAVREFKNGSASSERRAVPVNFDKTTVRVP